VTNKKNFKSRIFLDWHENWSTSRSLKAPLVRPNCEADSHLRLPLRLFHLHPRNPFRRSLSCKYTQLVLYTCLDSYKLNTVNTQGSYRHWNLLAVWCFPLVSHLSTCPFLNCLFLAIVCKYDIIYQTRKTAATAIGTTKIRCLDK